MKNKPDIEKLVERIEVLEDGLSELTTQLWKLVDPKPEEIEAVCEVLREHDDNWSPTDLDILKAILNGDRE
jgi:hypothetical protein